MYVRLKTCPTSMARMLTALKNLEAKGAGASARPTIPLPASPNAGAQTASDDSPPSRVRPLRSKAAVPAVVSFVETTALPVGLATEPVIVAESLTPTISLPLAPGESRGEGALIGSKAFGTQPSEPSLRNETPATSLEKSVRRTLGDPLRGQALVEMAERIRRDVEKTGGKTALLAGVGSESSAHEAALYAAAVLGRGQRVLLMDADVARRPLTSGFGRGAQPGLADLIQTQQQPRDLCLPTALE